MPNHRPQPDEYSPHHEQYVSLIQGPIFGELAAGRESIRQLIDQVPEERGGYRYAERKWTIRECIGHMADAERIHTFRALTFARNDGIDLPKWGPDAYAAAANFNARSIRSLVEEELAVRDATIALFSSLPSEAWSREGTVSGKRLTVRAIAYIAAGHVKRHMNVLRERYGVEQ
ncbi:MAG TPA: DinB family protein [Thermoanaerobaculia bacterium]|nr:DinB family protein [Thermoanaerobaculia bacterium]